MKFAGIYPVLITPMHEDGTVDWSGFEKNIEYFMQLDIGGVAINGSTGEFVSLTKEERLKAVIIAKEKIAGRKPLLVGTASETTAETIEYTKHAEENGADGALIINSYYAHPTEDEIYSHFKDVAESVKFPIMIYNNPFTSGINISTETILKVGKDIDNITHIKESSGEIRKARDIVKDGSEFIEVFCGSDDLALESFLVGAKGWISVAGNIVPELANDMYKAVKDNELNKAWELYYQILPLAEFLETSGKLVQIVKRAMELKGLAGGISRKPRLPLTIEEDEKLVTIMESLNAIKK